MNTLEYMTAFNTWLTNKMPVLKIEFDQECTSPVVHFLDKIGEHKEHKLQHDPNYVDPVEKVANSMFVGVITKETFEKAKRGELDMGVEGTIV